jgi:ribonuclease HII
MLLPFYKKNCVEAGVDEAGRGCLAGPVVAAAVILPKKFSYRLLNDSKQLNEKQRLECRIWIEENALAFAVHFIDNKKIDEVNILQATYLAMHGAINKLVLEPQHIIVDGNRFKPYKEIIATTIIKGDGLYSSIAAASILAKTYRDEYMQKAHKKFPLYAWNQNKGYPTAAHRKILAECGSSSLHRLSFKVKEKLQLSLFE